jgi:adenine phosphoribosyltransferase
VIDLRSMVREVPDFPTPGVGFKDVTPLLADPETLRSTVTLLADWVKTKQPDFVLGAEARGFWLGAAVASEAGVGFVPARRPGKLPPETVSARYVLEYGENSLELHPDLIPRGSKVVIHDDARHRRHRRGDLRSRCSWRAVGRFIIEPTFLGGRARLGDLDLHALISY